MVAQLQAEQGVEKVNYLSREDALGEFRNWSGFGGALDMLEENPLPAVAVVIPKLDFQGTESLNTLRDRITQINGIDEVRMDDSWFARGGVDRAGRARFGNDRRIDGGGSVPRHR